ncbi:autotransporter outer membrane beta-barrel domain-containing protein [Campylobacter geochelonis]|uniref:autotransporter outer membrane beta-barrel domain-containing protein n=1 Tax=Campylobacter geochelonis TaxID=1780362 RepID=UPI000770B7F7|nr:autotransporter outer membrane beta-barrel domain-containing protein [Campylobacter geochelonis]CZE49995.1 putative high-molecular-weight surface-exposed protein [Campylobacter geochelonis]
MNNKKTFALSVALCSALLANAQDLEWSAKKDPLIEIDGLKVLSPDKNSLTGNSVTVNSSDELTRVYGGYRGENDEEKDMSDNSVNITNAKITNNVFGSENFNGNVKESSIVIRSNDDAITPEKVIISGVQVTGGSSNKGSVNLNSIIIDHKDTDILSVFGGSTVEGKAEGNSVTLKRGTIKGDIYGGYTTKGNTKSNLVDITGGKVEGNIYGALTTNGDASENHITINNTEFKAGAGKSIVGAKSDKGANVITNTVTIEKSTINHNVYGAIGLAAKVEGNSVTITDSTLNGFVVGAEGKNANKNIVQIHSGTFKGSITGASSISGEARENRVLIENGDFKDYVTAANSKKAEANILNIDNGKFANLVMGADSSNGEANKNVVNIKNGTFNGNIYGGQGKSANENKININGGTFNGEIVGGFGSFVAKNNSIFIQGNPNLTNSTLYGGKAENHVAGTDISGNSLQINSTGLVAKNIVNFDSVNFFLPQDTRVGATALKLTDKAGTDLSATKVGVGMASGGVALKVNDKITLINTAGTFKMPKDLTNHKDSVTVPVGLTGFYEFKLSADNNNLYAVALGKPTTPPVVTPTPGVTPPVPTTPGTTAPTTPVVNPTVPVTTPVTTPTVPTTTKPSALQYDKTKVQKTKSFLEANLASLSLVNQSSDLIADNSTSIASQSSSDISTFGFLSIENSKTETGSYVDARGVSFATGVSKRIDAITYGAFFEAGVGEYDSYNDFGDSGVVKGKGDSKYYGAGVLLNFELAQDYSLDASIHAGKTQIDYKSSDFGTAADFDLKRTYISSHLGVNKAFKIDETNQINVFAKALYSRLSAKDATIASEEFKFDASTSLRSKIGLGYTYSANDDLALYSSAAYEHEFDGKAKGYHVSSGTQIDSPSLKGDSGVFGVGAKYSVDKVLFDANLQGYVGKKEGVSGGLKVEYKF